jgi:hypothetical protein
MILAGIYLYLKRERLESLMALAARGSRFDCEGFSDQDFRNLYALKYWGLVELYDKEFRITDRGWEWLLGWRKQPHAVVISNQHEILRYETETMTAPEDLMPEFQSVFLEVI